MEPKITKISQVNAADSTGKMVPSIQVDYMIGSHGPFSFVTPKQGFNLPAIKQEMQTMAQHIQGLV